MYYRFYDSASPNEIEYQTKRLFKNVAIAESFYKSLKSYSSKCVLKPV